MTLEQIIAKWSAMTPRERDAWVAEVVFDWDVHYPRLGFRFVADRDVEGTYVVDEVPEDMPEGLLCCTSQIVCRRVPDYTTDIAAAWTVFELTLDPNRSSLRPLGNGATGLYYAVMYDDEIEATGRTAPEAICLAALIAKLTSEVSE